MGINLKNRKTAKAAKQAEDVKAEKPARAPRAAKAEKTQPSGDSTTQTKPQPSPKAEKPARTPREPVAPEDRKSVVKQDRYSYAANDQKTASGRKAVDNGDAVAVAIRGLTADEVVAAVAASGTEVPARWAELNPGMRRMNAANTLRRLARGAEGVQIGGETVKIAKAAPAEAEEKQAA